MSKPMSVRELREHQKALLRGSDPRILHQIQKMEKACRQVIRKDCSLSHIFGISFPENHFERAICTFLLLRYPPLKLQPQWAANYLGITTYELRGHEARGLLIAAQGKHTEEGAAFSLICRILKTSPPELISGRALTHVE